MLSPRSFTTAIALALAFVAACARQEVPAACPPAPVAVAPAPAQVAPRASGIVTSTGRRLPDDPPTVPGRVRPDNQLPLGASTTAFASYLNVVHNKIHPDFADAQLAKLGDLPFKHPLNNVTLTTRVEMVIDGSTGALVELLVIQPSREAAFDAIVVDSIKRSGPFGEAPAAIRSADGNVYVHWAFKREEVYACSLMLARPFLLSSTSSPAGRPSSPSLPL